MLLNQSHDIASRHAAGIRQVVSSERNSLNPTGHAGIGKLVQLRKTVGGHQQSIITHHLADVVTCAVDVVERNPQSPDKAVLGTIQHLFPEGLAPRIEAAIVLAERKVGSITLFKAASISFGTRENAT